MSKIQKISKIVLPKRVLEVLRQWIRYKRLKKSYMYDLNHYYKYSMNDNNIVESKLISTIIKDTHVIEKGLTMPETRLGFGQSRLIGLINNMIKYISLFNSKNHQLLHSISVVNEYFEFHKCNKYIISEYLNSKYLELNEEIKNKDLSYVSRRQIEMTKEEYFSKNNNSFTAFSNSRSSVRNWTDEEVDLDLVKKSIDLCRNTPSACNRQSVRVHLYTEKKQINQILEMQGGNRGFGHLSAFLIIVTFEPSVFFEEGERNSGYVDGGMFCMNLLYALHTNKIAVCILNAAHTDVKDQKIRKITHIPESETFVAMIAGGVPPDKFMIARSYRYPLDSILDMH